MFLCHILSMHLNNDFNELEMHLRCQNETKFHGIGFQGQNI